MSAGSGSLQPLGLQVKVVASPPELGVMATDVIEGAVLPTVTELLVTEAPALVRIARMRRRGPSGVFPA